MDKLPSDKAMESIAVFDRNYNQITADEKDTVAILVIDAAFRFWVDADRVQDFCIQAIHDDCIVFGSVNRVVWRPATGFKMDVSYCTNHFLAANGYYSEDR